MTEMMVKSEITGKVWAIEAKIGAGLSEEDSIIILESMKMEIPIVAPRDGTLKKILVTEGESVVEGQEIAIMEV